MNKYATVCLVFLLTLHQALGNDLQELHMIAKVKKVGESYEIYRDNKNLLIPTQIKDKNIKKTLSTLEADDEVILTGRITYLRDIEQTQMKPVFLIEGVTPISLRRLALAKHDFPELSLSYPKFEVPYSKKEFLVSTEVASTITMTTSLMLLYNLASTSGPGSPHVVQSINQGLFLSAGVLAAGLFLYKQAVKKK